MCQVGLELELELERVQRIGSFGKGWRGFERRQSLCLVRLRAGRGEKVNISIGGCLVHL